MKTEYANKIINSNLYGIINTENAPIMKYLTEDEVKEGKEGYILVPYILNEHTEESSKQYNEFMIEYYKQHKYCPKCGGEQHITTLVGYVLNWNKKDDYKDMNRCECMICGDKHSAHDRVNKL